MTASSELMTTASGSVLAAPAVRFPLVARSRLPNGVHLWTARHGSLPVTTILLLVPRGTAHDPVGKEGLTALTLDLWLGDGPAGSALALHDELAAIGGQLATDIGPDGVLLRVTVLTRFTAIALSWLADLLTRTGPDRPTFDRGRRERLDRLQRARSSPTLTANRVLLKLIYGADRYGHPSLGTRRGLETVTLDDAQACHAAMCVPSRTTVIVVGDGDRTDVCRAAAGLGAWRAPAPPTDIAPAPATPGVYVVPRPDASQSIVRIGQRAAARSTPEYPALVMANTILGGHPLSRVSQLLRGDRGLTYTVTTAFSFHKRPGPFVLYVRVPVAYTGVTVTASVSEIAQLRGPRPVTREELAVATGLVRGEYPRSLETAEGVAAALAQVALYDLAPDTFPAFRAQVERIEPRDVTDAVARHLDPATLVTVVVGDVDAIVPQLVQRGGGEPRFVEPDFCW